MELDALVGTQVTGESPVIRWEDERTQLRFASVEEAVDALGDPYYGSFLQPESNAPTVFTEIREYPRYSTDLSAAWNVVERLTSSDEPLHVAVEGSRWVANFGERPAAIAPTAPVAICIAALQVKGVAVELAEEIVLAAAP